MIKEAMLYEILSDAIVHCYLCSHHCKIQPGRFGICGVRQNIDGKLHTHVYGEVIASHIDPIEKKPLYHFFPGSASYSIAAAGCNFRCGFCQNWQISQLGRDKTRSAVEGAAICAAPADIVQNAKKNNCKSISYTYTEPTIFFEYAYDIAKIAKKEWIYNIFVTNGYMTEEAIDTIRPYLDACNVDLKSFSEDFYAKMCGACLKPVLNSIKLMKKAGIWIEITTLLIPGKNDSDKELKDIAEFIAGLGIDIPWHISRFHPDYKYTESAPTSVESLRKAKDIGKKAGLKYVYLGNVLEGNNTYCYKCKSLLVKRVVFDIVSYNIEEGKCKVCQSIVDGRF